METWKKNHIEAMQRLGVSLRGLLNGQVGRLDCGIIDSIILDALKLHGFDEDGNQHGVEEEDTHDSETTEN